MMPPTTTSSLFPPQSTLQNPFITTTTPFSPPPSAAEPHWKPTARCHQTKQPINEFQSLSNSSPFSWASGEFVEYCSQLIATGVGFALFVGLPLSWYGSIGVGWEPMQRILGVVCSGIFAVTLAVVRMYLGWVYVVNQLLSATIECVYVSFNCSIVVCVVLIVITKSFTIGDFVVPIICWIL